MDNSIREDPEKIHAAFICEDSLEKIRTLKLFKHDMGHIVCSAAEDGFGVYEMK